MEREKQLRVTKQTETLQRRAEGLFPGGVNSPVRGFGAVGGGGPVVERGERCWLWDVDGNKYLDYFGSWGPMILGHAAPQVVEAIRVAAGKGTSFGASTKAEGELGEMVRECVPSMEKMRFVSSGTEACMSVIRLARGFTGRRFVVKFDGCYHGHSDGLLVKAGSGVATFGIPGSAGVLEETAKFTLSIPFNDLEAVRAAFAEHKDDVACVIVEPVVGNAGTLVAKDGFLKGLREICIEHGSLLIFDEVMTGFRVALGGAQGLYGIRPDLSTFGKIVGGGLPVGVFGGRKEIMDRLAPLGPVYQAGTLSGNPLAMAAGAATVGYLIENAGDVYPKLEKSTAAVAEGVVKIAEKLGVAMTMNRVGSMWTWFFKSGEITDFAGALGCDTAAFGVFHRAMMEQGVWLPPSQFEAAFVSTCIGEAEIAMTLKAAEVALNEVNAYLRG